MSEGQWIESATLDLWEGRHREQLKGIKELEARIKELTELCALEYQRAWLLETQKNIAEEKLAQQDDLVQAAVAAALREAAQAARLSISEREEWPPKDGDVLVDDCMAAILALIREGGK